MMGCTSEKEGAMDKRIFLSGLLCCFFLLRCGENQPHVTVDQKNVFPVGAIQGRVLDDKTGGVLAGVTVSTLTGGQWVSTTTASDGTYVLKNLPASASPGITYRVFFSKRGYVTRIMPATLNAGDNPSFPPGNVQVWLEVPDMSAPDAGFSGMVFTCSTCPQTGCSPTSDVTIYTDLRSSGYDLAAGATSQGGGGFTMTGLPAQRAGLTVSVVPNPPYSASDGVTTKYFCNSYTPSQWTVFHGAVVSVGNYYLCPCQ